MATGECGKSEQMLLEDARNGSLERHDLIDAALIAGGHLEPARRGELAAQVEAWIEELQAEKLPSEEIPRAKIVFTRLHTDLLTGKYDARCSDLAAAVETGDYNCVSATVLYVIALRELGIPAAPYSRVGHVYCRIGTENIDVETTCDRWFELSGSEAERARNRVVQALQASDAASRKLSDAELVAKIYYNRGVACFRREQYSQGLDLTRRSLEFDPHDDVARGNVLAGLNNWSLSLCREKQFEEAAALLDEIETLDPNYSTLDSNRAHLYRLWGKQRQAQ